MSESFDERNPENVGTGQGASAKHSSNGVLTPEPAIVAPISEGPGQPGAAAAQPTQNVLPPDDLEQFRKKIRDADELLDFAIREGVQVPDKIIIDINRAQAFLSPLSYPAWSDLASFAKARRDMAHFIGPLTVDTARAKTPGQWIKERSGIRRVVMAVSVLVLLAVLVLLTGPFDKKYGQDGLAVLGVVCCAVFILWGLSIFTGVATNSKLSQIIYFCYIFLIGALSLSLLPVFAFLHPDFSQLMAKTPLGLIQGCRASLPDKNANSTDAVIPQELRCEPADKPAFQWVINIGGVLTQSPSSTPDHKAEASPSKAGPIPQWTISGGIVVPLYVVVLSWMGSAVSMTRRVPEYQRRALDPREAFTNAQARENLVLQIMQVLSAPLIVVTVYYLFKPNTPAMSVLLGFASGFASEPILLVIRGLVEKLAPVVSPPAKPGTAPVTVTVAPSTVALKPGQAYTFVAEVTPTMANAQIQWSIDPPAPAGGAIAQTGHYTAPDALNGLKAVTITACSMTDRTKSGSATVNLI